jgi:chorismate mutase
MIRGARGAIQAENQARAIVDAAEELMRSLIDKNRISGAQVAAVFFTVTPDLNAAFPADVRRRIGWERVPFLCGQEIPVPGSLERVIRVLIMFETELGQEEVQHQYLGAAAALRPDLGKPRRD